MLNLNGIRNLIHGVAAGLVIAVLYLRGSGIANDSLNELRDGAILLILASFGLSVWKSRVVNKQRAA
ncbi:MAG: hypothetical protein EOP58_05785 [Sphingomonadales bacterium]|nr:MAG: hypothetical protein EOP58_05785 [Sphingomonadales bacterium]